MKLSDLSAFTRAPAEALEERLDVAVSAQTPSANVRYLVLLTGTTNGRIYPLSGKEHFIGRSTEANICIPEAALSFFHAKLTERDGEWWIEDLGSTNGTFINDDVASGRCRLCPGDVVRAGTVKFLYVTQVESQPVADNSFLGAVGASQVTALPHMGAPQLGPGPGGVLQLGAGSRTPGSHALMYAPAAPLHTAGPQPMLQAPPGYGQLSAPAVEEGVRLGDVLRRVELTFDYAKRHAWLLIALGSLGTAAGVSHARLLPPATDAFCEVALLSEARTNPMDKNATQDAFFVAPEQTFTSVPVIAATLARLNWPTDDEVIRQVQANLSFQQQGYKSELWRADYSAADIREAELFLGTHLQTYLDTEIEKTLAVIQTETRFLQEQLAETDRAVAAAELALVQFREKHPFVLPSGSEEPRPIFTGLGGGDVTAIEQELAIKRVELARGDVLLQDRVKAAHEYESALAEVNTKLAAANARGLAEQHPEMKQLRGQATELRQLADNVVSAAPTESERRANPEYRKLQEQTHLLEQQLAAGKTQAASSRAVADQEAEKRASLPQLESEYQRLDDASKAAKVLRDTLANKLKASQLQLDLERVSARAHYNVVSPPKAEPSSPTRAAIKRGVVGGVGGLCLAFGIAALWEFRRLARRYRVVSTT